MKQKIFIISFIAFVTFLLNFFSLSVNAQGGPVYGTTNMTGNMGLPVFFSTFILFMIVLEFLFNLVLAIIVYKDAVKNNNQNALLMGILVFLSGIIGLIVYFLVRKSNNQQTPSYTPMQSATISQTKYRNTFCSNCGSELESNSQFCQNCGAVVK